METFFRAEKADRQRTKAKFHLFECVETLYHYTDGLDQATSNLEHLHETKQLKVNISEYATLFSQLKAALADFAV